MPIDYSIPAKFGQYGVRLPSPMQAASTLASLREQTARQESLRAEQAKQATLASLLPNAINQDGSLNQSVVTLMATIDPDAAIKVGKLRDMQFPQLTQGQMSPTKISTVDDEGRNVTRLVYPGGRFEDYELPAEPTKAPSRSTYKKDGFEITEEFDPATGRYKEIARSKIGVDREQKGPSSKPPTESQQKFSLYYKSLEDALPALDSLYKSGYKPGADTMKLLSMDPTQWGTEIYSGALNISPQDMEFVSLVETLSEAIARPRSGAALTQKDIQSTLLGYIPRAGESPATVARKRAALGKQMDYLRRISEGGLAQREPGEITIGADRVNPPMKKPSGARPMPPIVFPTR